MSHQESHPSTGERSRIGQLAKNLQRAVLDHWLVDGAPLHENLGRVTWPTNCSLTEAGERFAVQAEKVGIPLRELKTAIADISPGSLSEDASDELKGIIQAFKARPSEGENTLWSLLCRGEQPEERGAKPVVAWSYEQRRALADLHSLVKTIPESIGRAPFHAVPWEDVQRLEAAAKVLCEAEAEAEENSPETTPPPVQAADAERNLTPNRYLTSWRDILAALELPNNQAERGKVRRLNEEREGPIILGRQGTQPKIEKTKLLEWWNHLEVQWQDEENQKEGIAAAASSQHPYGRNGMAAPEIRGSVKERRKDRKR